MKQTMECFDSGESAVPERAREGVTFLNPETGLTVDAYNNFAAAVALSLGYESLLKSVDDSEQFKLEKEYLLEMLELAENRMEEYGGYLCSQEYSAADFLAAEEAAKDNPNVELCNQLVRAFNATKEARQAFKKMLVSREFNESDADGRRALLKQYETVMRGKMDDIAREADDKLTRAGRVEQ